MSAQRYLQRIGHSWYVRVKVPRTLQAAAGNTHIRKALHTRDLDEANVLKWAHLKSIKAYLAKLRQVDPAADEAREIRNQLIEDRKAGADADDLEPTLDYAERKAREMEERSGSYAQAKEWHDLATATTPLLSELIDTWLEGENYKEATKMAHRLALRDLQGFIGGDKLPAMVTDDVAVKYVEDHLKKSGAAYYTQRRKLNSLVNFWKWLGLRKHVPRRFNPWAGVALSKSRTTKATPDKRAYTHEELVKLFAHPPKYEGLADVSVLALYTGARVNELCSLVMQDITRREGFYFITLRTGKGITRERRIAVSHEHAVAVLDRLWSSADAPKTQLFPSFKPAGPDRKLSWSVVKAFGRFRDAAGLTRATDFHSLRRSLITQLENASVDQVKIARYCGHSISTLAFQVYSGGSTEQTSIEVAQRVRYPVEVESAVARFLSA